MDLGPEPSNSVPAGVRVIQEEDMVDRPTAPADVVAELDEVIEQAEQAEAAVVVPGTSGFDATGLAEQMAADNGVDLAEVEGTGKDGRITVPDVDRFIKQKAAEADQAEEEAEASAKSGTETPDEESKPKPKAKAKAKAKGEAVTLLPPLPNIIRGLAEVHHTIRSVGEVGSGDWFNSIVSVQDADENLSAMMGDGWSLIKTQSMGYGPDGIEMLWVFGKFKEDAVVKDWPDREIHHVSRVVGGMGDDGRGVSGLAANALVNGYFETGWDLADVGALGEAVGGAVNMMWVFVR